MFELNIGFNEIENKRLQNYYAVYIKACDMKINNEAHKSKLFFKLTKGIAYNNIARFLIKKEFPNEIQEINTSEGIKYEFLLNDIETQSLDSYTTKYVEFHKLNINKRAELFEKVFKYVLLDYLFAYYS